MRSIGITAQEEEMISEMSTLSNNLIPLEEEAMALVDKGNNLGAIASVYSENYNTGIVKIREIADSFNESIAARSDKKLDNMGLYIDISFRITFVCLFLVAVVQIIVIFYVKRKLLKPILLIKDNMLLMSKGDLTTALAVATDNTEIGQLAFAVNDTKNRTNTIINDLDYVMNGLSKGDFTVQTGAEESYIGAYKPILSSMITLRIKLSETLAKIDESANQVSAGAEQLSNGAQALAQGATEQAASVETLSGAITDINNEIRGKLKNSCSSHRSRREYRK